MSQSTASPHHDDRELSTADALSAALEQFRDFDRRVANQRVLDSHVAQSAKTNDAAPRLTDSETSGERNER